MNDEIVMYLVFRSDLKMSTGKIAAQAGHAVQLILRELERDYLPMDPVCQERITAGWREEWEDGSYAKIALRVKDFDELNDVVCKLTSDGIVHSIVIDEGRTEISAKTVTCIAIQPMPRSRVNHIIGGLKLL